MLFIPGLSLAGRGLIYSESLAGLVVTGRGSRERLAAPVAEIRDATFSRSRSRRSGPDDLYQEITDKCGESVAHDAEERGDPPAVFGPQGSKLIGVYDSQVSFGQSRVLLVWTRLIFPNGRSIVLERQSGADTEGYAGLEDQVDYHWSRLFMAAALSTLLGVGSELGASNTDSDIVQEIGRAHV